MRLNKSLQYALLLVLYLCRAGRARLVDIAANLRLSLSFLSVIANKLRIGKVLRSVRGPGGGYEVNGEPSVRDVFYAISPVLILSNREANSYAKGNPEHRALARWVTGLENGLIPFMKKKVRTLNSELASNEMAVLNRLTDLSPVN